jgi:predicted regulator of Ras-like GTPase activity (Roadblock/LC7/MglB family)
MANLTDSLTDLMSLDGAQCAAVVDYESGMTLASAGSGIDMELAAAGNTEVVRAKVKTMKALGLNESIDDILITLGKQYHIIRPSEKNPGLFLYYVLDNKRANLALARRKVSDVESNMTM